MLHFDGGSGGRECEQTWNVIAVSSGGRQYKIELTLKQEDGKWTGTMSSKQGPVKLQ